LKDQTTFQHLVLRHLDEPEHQGLLEETNHMRSLSEDHEKEFLAIKRLWELSGQASRLQGVDAERSLQQLKVGMGISDSGKSHNIFFWMSIAASLFLAVFALWSVIFSKDEFPLLVKETRNGIIDSVRLADGSQIFLAENSKVSYPEKFDAAIRAVTLLKGKAFFKVAKDPKHAFEVTINHSVVSVLGTSFNINYTQSTIDLSVKTGRVAFRANSKTDPSILSAGEALSYDLEKNQLKKENGINATGWLTKELHFVDMPLDEVCRQLSDYYQVKVVLLGKMTTAKKLNANFSNTSIKEVLQVLKQTYPIKITEKDSIIYVKNL